MPTVCRPDCGAVIELSPEVRPGDLVECPNCAGHDLRVREENGRWSATLAYRVSCPDCDEVLTLPESGIVEVFNYGRNRQGLIPLWVGEGDMPTPSYISETAAKSFAAGETFYTYQRGIPELRRAIANYMARAYGSPFADGFVPFSPERFFVTTGGMHALQIAIRIVAGSGCCSAAA